MSNHVNSLTSFYLNVVHQLNIDDQKIKRISNDKKMYIRRLGMAYLQCSSALEGATRVMSWLPLEGILFLRRFNWIFLFYYNDVDVT